MSYVLRLQNLFDGTCVLEKVNKLKSMKYMYIGTWHICLLCDKINCRCN